MLRLLSNLDANESAFFLRELESIKAETYDILYPLLKARQLVPPDRQQAPSGAEVITYRTFDRVGMAKILASYAQDLPRVDVFGVETTTPIRGLGASYGYSLQDVRASAMMNRSLPMMKASAAREVVEELIDSIIALGDSVTGLPGFLNNSSVPQTSVATVNGATTFSDKLALDPDLVIDDVTDMVADQAELTKGREQMDTVLMPISQFRRLASTRMIDRDFTVLEYLRKAFPDITFDEWYRLTGAGAGSTDRMVGYRKDPSKIGYQVPQEFEQLQVQEEGLEFLVPCHARAGGTIVYYPLSMSYRDGI
jgi:hypothetical protein